MTLTFGSGQAQDQPDKASGEAGAHQSAPYQFPFSVPVNIIEDKATSDARDRHEQEARQREIEDLVAQQGMNFATQAMNDATQRMAEYAWWSTVFVGIGTLLLIFTLWLTRLANKAAQEAVAVTRDMGQRQLRAYLHVGANYPFAIIEGDVSSDGTKIVQGFGVSLSIENKGITPAKKFTFVAHARGTRNGAAVWERSLCAIDAGGDFEDISGSIGCNLSIRPIPNLQRLTQMERDEIDVEIEIGYQYEDVFGNRYPGTVLYSGRLGQQGFLRRMPFIVDKNFGLQSQ
ncbi:MULTISPECIES: hypothetical protein [Agrobacterium]|uniref:hypothetical protein n=2 Tax=Pseudomonadota TaxID=1224 RepID=UPI0022B81897|nr:MULTISPECIES: hypothetical protein [Agrobacterium]MCZ7887836.1 hypothetical protein [Agrobacterium salinitolerans]MDA5629893.1 hypothetical protein [Agrobacterium sp. ST15.16.055]MDA6980664.1 hypothetical protein [Agrobacterium salinitolerans]